MSKNLTNGKPLGLIVKFAVPILVGNLIQKFYHLIDSIFISHYVGLDAFAGTNAASFLIFLIFGFVFGVSEGCSIVLAQRFGAKSKVGVKLCIASSIYIYFFVTILITLASILALSPTLNLIGVPLDIIHHTKTYTLINYIGIFSVMAYNMFSQMLRAIGDSVAALVFLILSTTLNIVFDYIAVVILKYGVAGAAWATVLSQMISAVCCITYMFKKYKFTRLTLPYLRFKKVFFIRQLKLGLPMALECSVCAVGLLILQRAINSFGTNVLTGFSIAMRIEDLLITVFFALGSAATVFTAQNFGAKKLNRVRQGTRCSILLCLVTCIVFTIVFLLWWDFLVNMFIGKTPSKAGQIAQVKLAARQYIDLIIIHYIFLGSLIVMRHVVQSLGKTFVPLCGGFLELIARAIGAFLLKNWFGYAGVCFSTVLAWVFALIPIICSYFYNMNKFCKAQKVNTRL